MTAKEAPSWQQEEAERCFPLSLLRKKRVGAVVRSGGPGISDVEWHFGRASIAEDTVFEIGSLTKLFTAALLLQMVQHGEVALADPVSRYLPDGVASDSDVTLEEMVTHHSGLPRLPSDATFSVDPYATYTRERLVNWLRQNGMRTSGESPFLYSNLGYAVLGLALEGASGQSYPELLQKHVFDPFGMTHTRLALNQKIARTAIQGYSAAGLKTSHWTATAFAPAGAILSNAKDVGRFLSKMHDAAYAAALQPLAPAGASHIGYGWLLRLHKCRAWHNGGTGGFNSYASIDLSTGRWFVMLTNRSIPVINDVGVGLENLCFDSVKPQERPASPLAKPLLQELLIRILRFLPK